jgi:hypothetical protein
VIVAVKELEVQFDRELSRNNGADFGKGLIGRGQSLGIICLHSSLGLLNRNGKSIQYFLQVFLCRVLLNVKGNLEGHQNVVLLLFQ